MEDLRRGVGVSRCSGTGWKVGPTSQFLRGTRLVIPPNFFCKPVTTVICARQTDGFPNMVGGVLDAAATPHMRLAQGSRHSPGANAVPFNDATPVATTTSSGRPEEVSARNRAEGGGGVLLKGAGPLRRRDRRSAADEKDLQSTRCSVPSTCGEPGCTGPERDEGFEVQPDGKCRVVEGSVTLVDWSHRENGAFRLPAEVREQDDNAGRSCARRC